jgi:hypothetical protein
LFGWVPEFLDWLLGAAAWLVDQPVWAWDQLSLTVRATVVLATLGIALGFAIRKLRLRWLARSPRVQIIEFTWTGAEEKGRDGLWATSLFREQLSLLQTDPLDPLPERSPSAPLVDIVEGVSQGVTQKADFGKMAGRLFRAVWPAAAYEVWGTLRPLEEGKDRISVQLVDRARGNTTLVSDAFADNDWSSGARRAAMAVAGGLYPKIAKKHRGPWTGWRDAVPERLLSHYHEAQGHETKNRLAQAMDAYHCALREDPLNPELRLKIAMLQERLALDLDAWVTYLAIVDEVDRRAWKGHERQTRFVALYRLAILLGNGRIAGQWMETAAEPGRPTMRDTERARRRAELRTALEDDRMLTSGSPLGSRDARVSSSSAARLLDPMLPGRAARCEWVQETFPLLEEENGTVTERCRLIRRACGVAGESRGSAAQKRRIDEVLKLMSLRRLEDLDAWLSVLPPLWPRQWRSWLLCRPPLRQWLTRRILSRSVVRVSKRLARIQIAANLESRREAVAEIRKEHKVLTDAWPFPLPESASVRHHAQRLSVRRWWANRRGDSWQLHYNAACAVAAVLRPGSVWRNSADANGAAFEEGIGKDDIVEAAIDQLEQYAHRAGTDKVAAQADWVAFDDPDLDGLHETAAFQRWASHHIPRDLPDERPERSVDIEYYTARVLRDAARVFAKTWIERATGEEAGPAVTAAWWRTEADAWKRVAGACREHRSWRYRLEALEALKRWLEAHQKLDPIEFGHADRDETVASPEVTDGLFDEIAVLVGAPTDGARSPRRARATVLGWARSREIAMQALTENGSKSLTRGTRRSGGRQDAFKAARLWNQLADVLREELNRSPAAGNGGHPWIFLRPIRRELPRSPRWGYRSATAYVEVLKRRFAPRLGRG